MPASCACWPDFTPELEVYSIDEAFLDLSGFEHRLEAHARALRAIVLQWTGIPVSVGIAPTKTLAKAANRTAKKDPTSGGVALLLTTAAQELALGRMELTDLWGVARRTAEKLIALGITTPLQLRDADPRFLRERFSVVLERTVHELRGTPCIAFEDVTPNRKSIVASRSFGRPVLRPTEMAEAVATYTARAAEKMRRQGLATANLDRVRRDQPVSVRRPAALRQPGGAAARRDGRHRQAHQPPRCAVWPRSGAAGSATRRLVSCSSTWCRRPSCRPGCSTRPTLPPGNG